MFYCKFVPSLMNNKVGVSLLRSCYFGGGCMGGLGDNIFISKFCLEQDGLSL